MTLFRSLLRTILIALPLVFSQPLLAQPKGSGGATPYDTRNTVGIILLSGLVGGVLGLSTLSFYDRPQDHIRNITMGAGIGVIASALFLTVTVAQTPPPTASNWYLYPALVDSDTYALAFDLTF
jgi:hypothetical protein